jgi:hypothetical protein
VREVAGRLTAIQRSLLGSVNSVLITRSKSVLWGQNLYSSSQLIIDLDGRFSRESSTKNPREY